MLPHPMLWVRRSRSAVYRKRRWSGAITRPTSQSGARRRISAPKSPAPGHTTSYPERSKLSERTLSMAAPSGASSGSCATVYSARKTLIPDQYPRL
ncbi:hypothetical protein ASZ90_016675 [hydrocarbon metagenome]|uniref:Uncharacterized protein n=1 Tax=hydrocarbon metagenome TaxID=938273 RepID=A0A0W8EKS6_9ZZZZ